MIEFVHTQGADADAAIVQLFFISGSNLTLPSLASWRFGRCRFDLLDIRSFVPIAFYTALICVIIAETKRIP
jgi:hypothetical protein